jgi:ATP-dependent DNA helicase PIF1
MLNEMRFGTLTTKSISKFKALSRNLDDKDGIEPTELFVSSPESRRPH